MNKKLILKITSLFLLVSLIILSCKEEEYSLGELTAPQNLTITTEVVGQSSAEPNGDGSGMVNITPHADNATSYKIAFSEVSNLSAEPDFQLVDSETVSHKFTTLGAITYRITVVAYGAGGTSTTATQDVTVLSVFNPDPMIVTSLTGDASKTWKIQNDVAGHFGVGPWDDTSTTPAWWSAAPNEKASSPCFYNARFTFTKISDTSYSIESSTPDGVFTKTGALSTLPGIPASGAEDCYAYGGGTSAFSFVGSSSGVSSDASTKTSILLAGNTTFIAYGSLLKEYEILEINENYVHLRAQGTETGNAWYIKLVPAN